MAAIGDVALSLVTAEQKAQLALANFNFDFTLVKIPPPDEFKDVGKAISPKRKKDAEDGSSHIVARKLAALFTQDVDFPKVPSLIKAYGTRASQISQNKTFNPSRSRQYGVFADHIGLDGTTVWAAATSGSGAIAVHLLACMLATMWPGTHSTAIWHEMVLSRKAILQKRVEGTEFQLSDVTAAQIQIPREQLATWDTSARAWCQSANEAFALQQHQIRLIVQGFSKALPSSADVYSTVKRVWYKAMIVVDRLIQGIPQNVQDPEVLIGLLSWHIYPDVSVIGDKPKSILQKDPLVIPGGIVTLGMITNRESSSTGVSWSLPLSHLRYYGEPVLGKVTIEDSASRISFREFMYVALGGLTKTWFETLNEVEPPFRFLAALRNFYDRHSLNGRSWIRAIGTAADDFLKLEGDVRAEALQLVAYGRRKCRFFTTDSKFPAAFGLKRRPTQFKLLDTASAERRIAWLREQLPKALPTSYPTSSCIIAYRYMVDGQTSVRKKPKALPHRGEHDHAPHPDTSEPSIDVEFASLCPLGIFISNAQATSPQYRRWVSANQNSRLNAASVPGFHDVRTASALRCIALTENGEPSSLYLDHSSLSSYWEGWSVDTNGSRTTNGKLFFLPFSLRADLRTPLQSRSPQWNYAVRRLNPSFNAAKAVLGALSKDTGTASGTLRKPSTTLAMANEAQQHNLSPASTSKNTRTGKGDYGLADRGNNKPPCLLNSSIAKDHFQFSTNVDQYGCPHKWYVPEQAVPDTSTRKHYIWLNGDDQMSVCFPTEARPKFFASRIEHATELLDTDAFNASLLDTYLDSFFKINKIDEHLLSLHALALASRVYGELSDAKVPIAAATKPIYNYRWARQTREREFLSTAFACIATFETGNRELDIDPSDLTRVMALSVGDSLYMAQHLSCDPADSIQGFGVRRAIGNIGRPGLAFLVAPANPKMSKTDDSSWKIIKHEEYNGESEDNFSSTSLHLSFTGSELPISAGDLGLYDREAYFLEAVVGAFDGGRWVADLDILSHRDNFVYTRVTHPHKCLLGDAAEEQQQKGKPLGSLGHFTSIDSWTELLDPPDGKCVVRASRNWLARLALATVMAQKGASPLIYYDGGPDSHLCWVCIRAAVRERGLADFMILD